MNASYKQITVRGTFSLFIGRGQKNLVKRAIEFFNYEYNIWVYKPTQNTSIYNDMSYHITLKRIFYKFVPRCVVL